MLLTGWQGGCNEGVWVNHRTLTSQPHPVPYTLTHVPRTPPILPSTPPHPPPRHSDAAPLFRQVLELWQRVLGPEHPDTIRSIDDLAVCIRNTGRWAGSDATMCGWGDAAVCASQLGWQAAGGLGGPERVVAVRRQFVHECMMCVCTSRERCDSADAPSQ